jgi:uncharacterized membrane protein YccC
MKAEYVFLLSALVGICSAGLVWFLWELLQNIRAARKNTREKRNLVAQAAAIGRRAAEGAGGVDAAQK